MLNISKKNSTRYLLLNRTIFILKYPYLKGSLYVKISFWVQKNPLNERVKKGGRRDSNPRLLVPQTSALTN